MFPLFLNAIITSTPSLKPSVCSEPTESSIHLIIVLFFLLILRRRWWWRFLRSQVYPIQRTSGIEFQPRLYTVEIKHMFVVAREPNHQGILVCSKREIYISECSWSTIAVSKTHLPETLSHISDTHHPS